MGALFALSSLGLVWPRRRRTQIGKQEAEGTAAHGGISQGRVAAPTGHQSRLTCLRPQNLINILKM